MKSRRWALRLVGTFYVLVGFASMAGGIAMLVPPHHNVPAFGVGVVFVAGLGLGAAFGVGGLMLYVGKYEGVGCLFGGLGPLGILALGNAGYGARYGHWQRVGWSVAALAALAVLFALSVMVAAWGTKKSAQ